MATDSMATTSQMEQYLGMVSRSLGREAYILTREPEQLAPQLHNMLVLTDSADLPVEPLLARARSSLLDRRWLRLTNHPAVELASLSRVLDHGDRVMAVAWSPDGSTIASAGGTARAGEPWDAAVRLWNPQTGAPTATLEGQTTPIDALAWSPDGSRLAAGGWYNTLVWDAATHALSYELGRGAAVLAWSPDKTLLASGGDRGGLYLWDAATGEQRALLKGHRGTVEAIAWSPDGSTLASASSGLFEKTPVLWDPSTGARLGTLKKRRRRDTHSRRLAWSPSSTVLAVGRADGTIEVWDPIRRGLGALLGTPRRRRRPAGPGTPGWSSRPPTNIFLQTDLVQALAWAPDSAILASGSADKRVRIWAAETRQLMAVLEGHTESITALAWSPDGTMLASGSEDGMVRLWRPVLGGRGENPDETADVLDIAWSPDGRLIATANGEKGVRLWNPETGETEGAIDHEGWVFGVAWSPNGATLASGSRDRRVRLWDAATRTSTRVLRKQTSLFGALSWEASGAALAWRPDGQALAAGGWDHIVRVWDPITGARISKLKGHGGAIDVLAWSLDNTVLVSGAADNEVLLWEGSPLRSRVVSKRTATRAVAWSPDNTLLAIGNFGGTIRLWDRLRARDLAVLEGHEGNVLCLAWSPDQRILASGSSDRTLRLWDPISRECLVTAHCLAPVRALQFSTTGEILRAADSGDATGNRPVPYLFEVCNIDIDPAVERRVH